jgi:hypothetical protein
MSTQLTGLNVVELALLALAKPLIRPILLEAG